MPPLQSCRLHRRNRHERNQVRAGAAAPPSIRIRERLIYPSDAQAADTSKLGRPCREARDRTGLRSAIRVGTRHPLRYVREVAPTAIHSR